ILFQLLLYHLRIVIKISSFETSLIDLEQRLREKTTQLDYAVHQNRIGFCRKDGQQIAARRQDFAATYGHRTRRRVNLKRV
ncbi:MAG: hypothetical protein V1897_13250, partial [Pseudomonadota bacterium]